MENNDRQETDHELDDLDEIIKELEGLLDDLGEDLAMMAAIMAYLNASEQ